MAEPEQATDTKGIAYVSAYGAIGRTFEKIIEASTPSRFTQDYITTKLGIKGGNGKAMLPFLKRTGFLNSDGSPTDQYHQFRNADERGRAAANALKTGFQPLYEVNEYAHELSDDKLKGLVVQVTGSAPTASTVKSIIGSFKALKQYADFDAAESTADNVGVDNTTPPQSGGFTAPKTTPKGIQLGYTINLNLPATNDIGVYDAIFKSLKEHLLDR
jgi:hypothetical protein